jgi:hypothetical protein
MAYDGYDSALPAVSMMGGWMDGHGYSYTMSVGKKIG